MATVRIKICGVTTPEDARMAADAGADAVGLNFYPRSPRYLAPQQAARIVRALPAFTAPVGVFVGMPLRQVCAISFQLGLRAIQTYDLSLSGTSADSSEFGMRSSECGMEDPFPFAHIPAFRVKDAADLQLIREYVGRATALCLQPAAVLVDSRVEGMMGGSGHVAPWALLAGFDPGVPLILAGGLTCANVVEAIEQVRPWGVDVASGVESSPGRKDPAKVAKFIQSIRSIPG